MDDVKTALFCYGADDAVLASAAQFPELILARIVSQSRDLYRIVTDAGEGLAEVSGRFRHGAARISDFPAVGDFVLVDRTEDAAGNAIIHHVLPRKSAFERKAVGEAGTQIIAANVDTVFICMSLNDDFNLNRLERYLSLGWSSGSFPVVVLTKADLCDSVEELTAQVADVAFNADVITTSKLDADALGQIRSYLQEGMTASFIGSSGVGKSTLINRLIGEDFLATSAIREDDGKGRHTTTRRDLLLLPQGGVVIDTPGMRELGVESADLSKSFSDIDELASRCRFNDCTHTSEPDCAVKEALMEGVLDARRFENYRKLQKESKYEGLSARQIEAEKISSMVGGFSQMKQVRDQVKKKNSRR